jgi:hypothetical protein
LRNFPIWVSAYDMRPASLFEGVAQRLNIVIAQNRLGQAEERFSGGYRRWSSNERPNLVQQTAYTPLKEPNGSEPIPKFSSPIEHSILAKIAGPSLAQFLNDRAQPILVHRIVRYFVKALKFTPLFIDARGRKGKSEDYKEFRFEAAERDQITALLNSTLFYWFWRSHCDGFHCGYNDVYSMPYKKPAEAARRKTLQGLLMKLMKQIQQLSEERKITTKAGLIRYQEFYPSQSKLIIDEIDKILASHYGFAEYELDFLINYDIKYRLGREGETEEDGS